LNATDYPTSTQGEGRCPRCGEGPLKAWYELSEEEREVALRLPAAVDAVDAADADAADAAGRAARHRFCTRCWHEEGDDRARLA